MTASSRARRSDPARAPRSRRLLIQAAMRTMLVVVGHVLGQNLLEMAATEDEESVEHSRRMVPTSRPAIAFAEVVNLKGASARFGR